MFWTTLRIRLMGNKKRIENTAPTSKQSSHQSLLEEDQERQDPYEDLRYEPRILKPLIRFKDSKLNKTKTSYVLKKKCMPEINPIKQITYKNEQRKSTKSAKCNESLSQSSNIFEEFNLKAGKNRASVSGEQRKPTKFANNKEILCQRSKNLEQSQRKTSFITSSGVIKVVDRRASQKQIQDWNSLALEAIKPTPLTTWKAPGESPSGPPPTEILHRYKPLSNCHYDRLEEKRRWQHRALERYNQIQQDQLRIENYVMSKTNRKRGYLCSRRSQILPQSEPDGLEKSITTQERLIKPDVFPPWAHYKAPLFTHTGLTPQFSKKSCGYITVHDWVGYPEITDGMLKNVRSNEYDSFITENVGNTAGKLGKNKFSPYMPGLGVIGKKYTTAQRNIRANSTKNVKVIFEEDQTSKSPDINKYLSPFYDKLKLVRSHSGRFSSSLCLVDIMQESQVSMLFEDKLLFYTKEPQRAKNEWIIEVGCPSEVSERAKNYVHLQNTGTTAIHFNWVKGDYTDPFNVHRRENSFIFDHFGGTLLPGEIFRLPILYRCNKVGYYSEDWLLQTKPVLENGAKVILRMWGFCRQHKPFNRTIEKIDEYIKARIPWTIAAHRVDKIIDYLPLSDETFTDVRFPIIDLGPDKFTTNNPWLYYHSAHVYRLEKLNEIIIFRKVKRERKEGNFEDTSSTSSEGLTSKTSSYSEILEINVAIDEYTGDSSSSNSSMSSELSARALHGTYSEMIEMADTILRKRIDPDAPELRIATVSNDSVLWKKAMEQKNGLMNRETNLQENFLEDTRDAINDAALSAARTITGEALFGSAIGNPREEETAKISTKGKISRAPINLISGSFTIASMRDENLKDDVVPEVQEAIFNIIATETDALNFKPFESIENWMQTVVYSLFSYAVDEFSQFAGNLKTTCYEAETTYQRKQLEKESLTLTQRSSGFQEDPNESLEDTKPMQTTEKQKAPTKEIIKANLIAEKLYSPKQSDFQTGQFDNAGEENESEHESSEASLHTLLPHNFLSSDRLRDQYYGRLFQRMHQLLVDMFDSMDTLLSTHKKTEISDAYAYNIRYGDVAFQSVHNIPMPLNLKEALSAPLPPSYIGMSQLIDKSAATIRHRKQEYQAEKDARTDDYDW